LYLGKLLGYLHIHSRLWIIPRTTSLGNIKRWPVKKIAKQKKPGQGWMIFTPYFSIAKDGILDGNHSLMEHGCTWYGTRQQPYKYKPNDIVKK
jgi:hypothetical protein